MDLTSIKYIALIIIFTLLSGVGDAKGFIYADAVWKNGQFILPAALKSLLGYFFGAAAYFMAIKYLHEFKIFSPEAQTLGWFTVTIVGIALFSGKFFEWALIDKVVGIFVIVAVGWLLFRNGG